MAPLWLYRVKTPLIIVSDVLPKCPGDHHLSMPDSQTHVGKPRVEVAFLHQSYII